MGNKASKHLLVRHQEVPARCRACTRKPPKCRLPVSGTAGLGASVVVVMASKVSRDPPVFTVQTPGDSGGGLGGGGGGGLGGGVAVAGVGLGGGLDGGGSELTGSCVGGGGLDGGGDGIAAGGWEAGGGGEYALTGGGGLGGGEEDGGRGGGLGPTTLMQRLSRANWVPVTASPSAWNVTVSMPCVKAPLSRLRQRIENQHA